MVCGRNPPTPILVRLDKNDSSRPPTEGRGAGRGYRSSNKLSTPWLGRGSQAPSCIMIVGYNMVSWAFSVLTGGSARIALVWHSMSLLSCGTRERIGFPRAASSGDENAMPGTFTKQGKGYDVVEGAKLRRGQRVVQVVSATPHECFFPADAPWPHRIAYLRRSSGTLTPNRNFRTTSM
jgi:hypothetical protein